MPLQSGIGPKTLADNISELMKSYKSKGTIGTSTPKDPKLAQKQAIAIAYKKQGEMK